MTTAPVSNLDTSDTEALLKRSEELRNAHEIFASNVTASTSSLWHHYHRGPLNLGGIVNYEADDLYIRDSEDANAQFSAVACIDTKWAEARYIGLVSLPDEIKCEPNAARVSASENATRIWYEQRAEYEKAQNTANGDVA